MRRFIFILLVLIFPISFLFFALTGGVQEWKDWNKSEHQEKKEGLLQFFFLEIHMKYWE